MTMSEHVAPWNRRPVLTATGLSASATGGPSGRIAALPKGDLDPGVAWRHVDLLLVAAFAGISAIGALMVYAATRHRLSSTSVDRTFLTRQLVFIVLGAGLMAFTTAVDYRRLAALWPVIYGASVFSLLAVMTPLGAARKGAQRGFAFPGGLQLQPSEIAKLGLILTVAGFCARQRSDGDRVPVGPRRLAQALALVGVPLLLVLVQPDLGTSLVFGAVTVAMLAVSGLKGRYLVVLGLIVVLAAVGVVRAGVLKQYQQDRLTVFLNPENSIRGEAFNLNQSKIAIGSGGLTGQGLFQGTQTRLRYVPEQHTDFIFSVVGEELGLAGSSLLLALYALAMWRIWRAAVLSHEAVGSLICIGVLAMLCFQMFENIGMTMGIMPVTGIPLPFVSYGGSSMLVCSIGIGLVLNVHMRRYR